LDLWQDEVVEYQSLQDILADEDLALSDTKATVDDVRHAIDARLRALQTDTIVRTPDIYRRLINARDSLDRLGKEIPEHKSTELVPITLLERVLDVIQKPVPNSGSQEPTATERMQKSRSVAITKASEDFRHRRALPTAGIGAIAAAIWATRQIFGVNLTHVGTIAWAAGAGSVIIIAIIVLLLMRKAQSNDERALRRLFDPDVQGSALDEYGPITRSEYRTHLWYMSVTPIRRPAARIAFIRRLRRLHVNRLRGLEHRTMETMHRMEDDPGSEVDRDRLQEMLSMYREKLKSYRPPSSLYSRTYMLTHRFAGEGESRFLSTVDLASALDEASQLALTRFIEIGILESTQSRGLEEFRIKET
jgi:hypothetical protein